MDIHRLRPIPECHSSFGCREVPESAHNWEPLPKTDPLKSQKMESRKLETPGTFKDIWSLLISHLVLAFLEVNLNTSQSPHLDRPETTCWTSWQTSIFNGLSSRKVPFTSQDNLLQDTTFLLLPWKSWKIQLSSRASLLQVLQLEMVGLILIVKSTFLTHISIVLESLHPNSEILSLGFRHNPSETKLWETTSM